MVGRVYSGYKNLDLVYKTLELLRVPRESLVVVGPEKPAYGFFLHNLPVTELNELYNSARFTFCLSSWEGLGLSLIESVVTNTFPICLSSNPIIKELGLSEFATDPDPGAIATKINQIYTDQSYYRSILAELRPKYIEKFSLNAVCSKIMGLYTEYKKNYE
jgi:glycosyltransferase involved in cell wall biosynthesis